MGKQILAVIWDYVKSLVVAVIIALIIRSYIFQITEVYGQSMYPTLHDQDRLFTNKIVYRINRPARGDIIILDAPDRVGAYYVKRVIAVAGDHLVIKGGLVLLNGQEVNEPYVTGGFTDGDIDTIVPEGTVFVMGDNRSHSHDSRSAEVSFIPVQDIEGKAVFRIWPLHDLGLIN